MDLSAAHSEKPLPFSGNTVASADQIAFLRVDPAIIDKVWDRCVPFIESSFSKNAPAYEVSDVKKNLLTNECQLWIAMGRGKIMAAVVTMLTVEPKAKTCVIVHLGGENIRLWINELDAVLTAFARENGCQYVEAVTRKGFDYFVPDFVQDGIVYIKRITHG